MKTLIIFFFAILLCNQGIGQALTVAQKYYMEAIKKSPDSVALYKMLGIRNVVKFSTKEINSGGTNVELQYYIRNVAKRELGDVYGAMHDLDRTILQLQNKKQIYPFNLLAMAHMSRGVYLISAGQQEKGCLDLSVVGELGGESIYSLIKDVCYVNLTIKKFASLK
jgi:hypothetical protein